MDVETIIEWDPQDFTGVVYEPGLSSDLSRFEKFPAFEGFPAPGVTITIMAGPRAGESIMTDNKGDISSRILKEMNSIFGRRESSLSQRK